MRKSGSISLKSRMLSYQNLVASFFTKHPSRCCKFCYRFHCSEKVNSGSLWLLLAFGKLVAGNLTSDISVSWGGTQIEEERGQTAPSLCVKVLCTHFFYNVCPALHTRYQRSSAEMIPRLWDCPWMTCHTPSARVRFGPRSVGHHSLQSDSYSIIFPLSKLALERVPQALQHLSSSALFLILFTGENATPVNSSNSLWFFGEAFLTTETIRSAEPFMSPNLETIEVIITWKLF